MSHTPNHKTKQEDNKRDQYFKDRAGTDEARIHVVPYDKEGWAVKTEGKDKPDYMTGLKPEAVKEAKLMAEEAGIMVHRHLHLHSTITRNKRTYFN
ncbi:DUF2188 domain-containing protein [Aneurinibacillus sp. Ricciae_BoGa-3]|uniref:DUF2188 domain-containing protein n=1 Tax=Aneurinibacillus sp. Ricciae_BoGa-3 TaxID=3022697 RepID=UPI0023428526|nr:DUF2188 domain-containing protein [Aneurinibacillus sp. Ricciae_BoGa-3]WCK56341.1 DUF2188 domain-containing protein [Aneurinibacillus sp. Ricciae_BoGa-3]